MLPKCRFINKMVIIIIFTAIRSVYAHIHNKVGNAACKQLVVERHAADPVLSSLATQSNSGIHYYSRQTSTAADAILACGQFSVELPSRKLNVAQFVEVVHHNHHHQ